MAPKNLLRHAKCRSNLEEFDDQQGHPGSDRQGTRFKRLIKDVRNHSDKEEGIKRLVLTSGKVSKVQLRKVKVDVSFGFDLVYVS